MTKEKRIKQNVFFSALVTRRLSECFKQHLVKLILTYDVEKIITEMWLKFPNFHRFLFPFFNIVRVCQHFAHGSQILRFKNRIFTTLHAYVQKFRQPDILQIKYQKSFYLFFLADRIQAFVTLQLPRYNHDLKVQISLQLNFVL